MLHNSTANSAYSYPKNKYLEEQSYLNVCRRTAPKEMPPIFLCWPTAPEVDVGGLDVEVELTLILEGVKQLEPFFRYRTWLLLKYISLLIHCYRKRLRSYNTQYFFRALILLHNYKTCVMV